MGSQHIYSLKAPMTASLRHTNRSPREALAELADDRREAKAQLRDVLERLAQSHGISQKDINYALDGYADDMLSDLLYSVERDLEHAEEQSTGA
ncbi:hypothetical protein BH11PSE3_BH11PSE3_44470 [soil metagenome]